MSSPEPAAPLLAAPPVAPAKHSPSPSLSVVSRQPESSIAPTPLPLSVHAVPSPSPAGKSPPAPPPQLNDPTVPLSPPTGRSPSPAPPVHDPPIPSPSPALPVTDPPIPSPSPAPPVSNRPIPSPSPAPPVNDPPIPSPQPPPPVNDPPIPSPPPPPPVNDLPIPSPSPVHGGPLPTPPVNDPPPPPPPSPPATGPPRTAPHPPGGGPRNGTIGSPPGPGGKLGFLPTPPPHRGEDSSTGASRQWLVCGITAGAVVALVFLAMACFFIKKKKGRSQSIFYMPPPSKGPTDKLQKNGPQVVNRLAKPWTPSALPSMKPNHGRSSSASSTSNHSVLPGMALLGRSNFTYEELAVATDGFSDANLLGQGGFGYVHKGVLPNGKEVAVKHLKAESMQGEREFQAEVEIISTVHHKHLVSLVGYCISGSHLMLVYEFIPNGTLEWHLHGKGRPVMDWPTRMQIAIGSAKGLAYLHEDCHPKIIHRDIKASNILLDFDFEPMVADFGLAKFTPDEYTHVSTRIMGTIGYLAPEYASFGKLTDKSDVFSFGVMLLELITGRRPFDKKQSNTDEGLVDWARALLSRALEDGNLDTISDPRLEKGYNQFEMVRMVACASACIRHFARHRPAMSLVVRALQGNVSLSQLNGSGEDDSCTPYNENMSKFWRALDTQQHTATTTDQYSNHSTSDYGLHPLDSTTEYDRIMRKESLGFSGATAAS